MERTPGRLRLLRERARDDEAIEEMNEAAFGPDRTHKTVYRLREDVKPIKELCFVAIDQKGRMVASIRNWPILINERWPAVLLGPLAISPELRGLGYGKALMWHSMAQSRMLGHSRIILVGDPEYYNQFGFRRDLALNIQLPGLGRGAAVPGARAGRRLDDRRARHDRQMGCAQGGGSRTQAQTGLAHCWERATPWRSCCVIHARCATEWRAPSKDYERRATTMNSRLVSVRSASDPSRRTRPLAQGLPPPAIA